MEFLVSMSTHVPEGTSDAAVDDVRAREAAHSRELASQGHLLGLWRPPLAPGQGPSLGLFDAGDPTALEKILRSTPLRVWRTDEVVQLSPHPNDPGRQTKQERSSQAEGSEFFTTFTIGARRHDEGRDRRGRRPRGRSGAAAGRPGPAAPALGTAGRRSRPRTVAGRRHREMEAVLASLPSQPRAQVETVQLSGHPSDPGLTHS